MSNLHYISKSSKQQTIQSFFNKSGNQSTSDAPTSSRGFDESHSFKCYRLESEKVDASFEREPGLRKPIWMYDFNQQDKVRRAYIDMRQFQPKLESYKPTHDGNQNRRFHGFKFQISPPPIFFLVTPLPTKHTLKWIQD